MSEYHKATIFFFQLICCTLFALHAYSENINFKSLSLTEARKQARAAQKPLFVDIYATWCGPCKKMEQEVFNNSSVASFMNLHYLSIRIDAEKQDQGQIAALKITTYPTLLFLDETGKTVLRHEGALVADDFLRKASGLADFAEFKQDYERRSNDAESVYNYLSVLNWMQPSRAQSLARSYLIDLPEKKYDEEFNWKLIQLFVQPLDKPLFSKVISHAELPGQYPLEFKNFALQAVNSLVDKAIAQRKESTVGVALGYVRQYPSYFPNPDSLQVALQLRYAIQLKTAQLVPLLKQYYEKYGSDNPDDQVLLAYDLVQRYFQRELLDYAQSLADKSIQQRPTAMAYVVKALAQEKLINYKTAYANILHAYEYADDETTRLLNEYEQRLKERIDYEFATGVNATSLQNRREDGRFTLGVGAKRLMYGFPVPESTSHFIVNIDGKLASNAPHLEANGVTYLTGSIKYEGEASTPTVSIEYTFQKVSIRQELVPVDREGKEIVSGFAQYYRVTYSLQSKETVSHKVGLSVLFDTMVDDNDNCNIMAGNRAIAVESKFSGADIPATLQFYHTPKDTSGMMGAAILDGLSASRPDHLVVGRWPVLHNVSWQPTVRRVRYGDSGYFLTWENRQLKPNDKIQFRTYYGLPDFKKPELSVVMKGELFLTRSVSIYFEHERDHLDLNAKMMLNTLTDDSGIVIKGIILNGYADITGNEGYNFALSERRIQQVAKILRAKGIPVVPKPHGIDNAQRTVLDQQYGNAWDRKVEVVVYYRKKSTSLIVN